MSFAHEKLKVYQKGLESFASVQPLLSSWSKTHAFVDHLSRALESILFNLVEATRLRQEPKKLLTLDYALGSTFECAACLDVAVLKGLLDAATSVEEKQRLLEVCKMLIGLRNSWMTPRVAEDGCTYTTAQPKGLESRVFHHETLDMYRVALSFYRWLLSTGPGKHLATGFDRSVDVLATRVVLNIAEGNGRYAELSRQGFLDTANKAVAKLAVSLDMGGRRNVWTQEEIAEAKPLLERIGQMTARKDYG
ncbi:MAG: four helix bundle protein [Verrucomicrobia bacterium]|jgi:four helix bundle protein|nr:four helix bundle protein [Verrucomicrobiota bacterium]MBT7068614.1 four helix bundle protein [Verrucomicrobiota bacterium]MBT7701783.1 four helix bundle protein [Verrucomicrobiota bacterium]